MNWEQKTKNLLGQIRNLKNSIEPMAKTELRIIWAGISSIPKDASREEYKAQLTSSLKKVHVLLKDIEGEIKAAFTLRKSTSKKSQKPAARTKKVSSKKSVSKSKMKPSRRNN